MDTALILFHAFFVLRLAPRSPRRDELGLVALGRNRRQAREIVQQRDDAAAEISTSVKVCVSPPRLTASDGNRNT
jgi:hypothetical protein